MMRLIAAGSGIIIVTGLLWDGYKRLKSRKKTTSQEGSEPLS